MIMAFKSEVAIAARGTSSICFALSSYASGMVTHAVECMLHRSTASCMLIQVIRSLLGVWHKYRLYVRGHEDDLLQVTIVHDSIRECHS